MNGKKTIFGSFELSGCYAGIRIKVSFYESCSTSVKFSIENLKTEIRYFGKLKLEFDNRDELLSMEIFFILLDHQDSDAKLIKRFLNQIFFATASVSIEVSSEKYCLEVEKTSWKPKWIKNIDSFYKYQSSRLRYRDQFERYCKQVFFLCVKVPNDNLMEGFKPIVLEKHEFKNWNQSNLLKHQL